MPEPVNTSEPPWFRQIDGHQWRAFLATFFGWLLDGFDFTVMTFILVDIQDSFTVDAGASPDSTLGWRVMFWTGVIPALMVLWVL